MMIVLHLRTARDKYQPSIKDPPETDFKVADMALLKNHTQTTAFDVKYKNSYQICRQLSYKAFDIQDNTGKVRCIFI